MSEKNWQPGDVAMVTYAVDHHKETSAFVKSEKGWDCLRPGVGFLMHGDVMDARPLVILDPEDREQMERLAEIYREVGEGNAVLNDEPWTIPGLLMQAALREFANPKPRIEEPQGLGAVVELQDGEVVVLTQGGGNQANWCDKYGDFHFWSDLHVVRVISEGHEAGESE